MPVARPSQRAGALECAHWVAASFRISDALQLTAIIVARLHVFGRFKLLVHDVVDDPDDDGSNRTILRIEYLPRAVAFVEDEDALVSAGAD